MTKAGGLKFVEVSDYLQGWTIDGTLATGQTAGTSEKDDRFEEVKKARNVGLNTTEE